MGVKIISWSKDGETVILIEIGLLDLSSFSSINMSIRGFQDASAQGTEGLAMKESKPVKMPLYGSQRV